MTMIEALLKLLSCRIVDGRQASEAIIEEKDVSAKLKKITLSDLQPGILVLLIDEGRKVRLGGKVVIDCMSPLFNITGDSHHNRACDAVLIREKSASECEVVYIDLKSDAPSGFKGQFQSTYCFVRYVQALLLELLKVEMKIVKERYVIFHTDSRNANVSLQKRPTKFSPSQANSPVAPDKYVVRSGDTRRCTEIL